MPYVDLIELKDIAYFLNIQFIFIINISLTKTKSRQKKNVALKTKQHITRRGKWDGGGTGEKGVVLYEYSGGSCRFSSSLLLSHRLALESTGQILSRGVTRGTIDLAVVVAAIGIEAVEAANDRGDGGVVVLLELVGAAQLVVLSLDLLLGLVRLLVGLVLDEEHLRLAGLCGRGRGNVSGVQVVVLLAQHIDDSLLLLWCELGRVFHIGIVACRCLDEDHTVVLLRPAQHQVLSLAIVAVILRRGDQVELLVDDRCLCGACGGQILVAATVWHRQLAHQLAGITQSQAADANAAAHVAQQITNLRLLVAVLGTCLG